MVMDLKKIMQLLLRWNVAHHHGSCIQSLV